MNSQASDSNEEDYGVNSEEEDDDDAGEEEDPGDIASYYDGVASDVEQQGADSFDPEEYQFTCLTYKESQRVLTEEVNTVAVALKVSVCLTEPAEDYGFVAALGKEGPNSQWLLWSNKLWRERHTFSMSSKSDKIESDVHPVTDCWISAESSPMFVSYLMSMLIQFSIASFSLL